MLEFLAQSQLTINKALKKWKSHLSAGRERGGERGGGREGGGGGSSSKWRLYIFGISAKSIFKHCLRFLVSLVLSQLSIKLI